MNGRSGKRNKYSSEQSHETSLHFPVPEMMINQLGYMAMSQKKMDEAAYLFKSNASKYPGSFDVHDSLVNFYAAKVKKRAIKNCHKALTIKEIKETRSKLEVLLK